MGSSAWAAGTQHLAESVSSELIFVSSLMQYCTSFPSANAGIHLANDRCDWLQLTQILPCFVLYQGPILHNGSFIVHLPWKQQLAVKSISQASQCEQSLFSYRPEMAIRIQNSLQRPMKELAGPGGKCDEKCSGRGNTLAFKEAKPSSGNLFIESNKGNLSCSSK